MQPDDDTIEQLETYPLIKVQEPKPFRDVYDPFDYHVTSADCQEQLKFTRGQFKDLRDFILETVPNCRERSLAITALQDALMRTIQAIVFTHPDSVPQVD